MTNETKLHEALRDALEWIDAVPVDVAASLPAMPGFDRDKVDELLAAQSQPAATVQGAWRDISSAPDDGTEILGYRPDQGVFMFRWAWMEEFVAKDIKGDPLEDYDDARGGWWHDRWGWLEGELAPTLWALPAVPGAARPLDMLLWCPKCNAQHIDEASEGWDNPPHRSHLCHNCGCIWRPADVATNGVSSIKTAGSADSFSAAQSQPAATVQEVGREAHDAFFAGFALGVLFMSKDNQPLAPEAWEAYRSTRAALTAEPAAKAGDAVATVRTIETVTGDFMTEPGEPFYRIELNGYCADFDHEEAAKNFAAQINALAPPSPQPDRGSGRAIGLIGEASFAEVVDSDFWSLQLHFGKGDDARDKMRAVSDALRSVVALRHKEEATPVTQVEGLREALKGALEWIDAIPADVVANLPAMPGFDRDRVDELIAATTERGRG